MPNAPTDRAVLLGDYADRFMEHWFTGTILKAVPGARKVTATLRGGEVRFAAEFPGITIVTSRRIPE